MEEYRGFQIDTDLCDHNVTVIHEVFGIKEVFGTERLAKIYIDGILKGISLAATIK